MARFLNRPAATAGGMADPRYAPGTKIPYKEELVEELVWEHREMSLMLKQIAQAQEDADHIRIFELLNELKKHLSAHLLKEQTHLYLYLKHVTLETGYGHRTFTKLHREMSAIGITVTRFVEKWIMDGNVFYDEPFLKEFKVIENALTKRIEKEEDGLFSFYTELGRIPRIW